MNTEEHDDLWQLLGKAKQPSASPFFARNILRNVRAADQSNPSLLALLCRKWVIGAIGATAAILLTVNSSHFFNASDPDAALLAQQVYSKSDVEVIDDLDELIAWNEDAVWLENSPQ